jgi:DNA polymerase III alpha subunit
MLRTGRTMGCFYIESPAMRQLLKRLGTQDFLELTAASSVIRPGVAESGMMQEYIRRSRGLPEEQPSHPKMRELMPETHGVMIYQEDVIHAAHAFAGFTRAQADVLRRGMSGKLRSREQINELREGFVRGCINNGLSTRDALEIWRQVESFSGYAFCKAHSASFATLSMQVAWLKAHHPAEFMAAVLSNGGGFYGPQTYISECWRLGLSVLPPDVNMSQLDYRAEYGGKEQGLRVGLAVIKRLPLLLKERIIAAREAGGPYGSLQDFIRRAKPGPGWLSVLIDCGALDCLGLSRAELLRLAGDEYGRAITDARAGERQLFKDDESAEAAQQQVGLVEQLDPRELMRRDLEHFGFYCRFHPLVWVEERYPQLVRARDMPKYCGQQVTMLGWQVAGKRVSVKDRKAGRDWLALIGEELDQPEEYFEEEDEEKQSAAEDLGILNSLGTSIYRNRTGRSMLMLSLEDLSDTFESVLFPDAWERLATVVYDGGPWLLRGTVDEMLGACTLNVQAMKHVEL